MFKRHRGELKMKHNNNPRTFTPAQIVEAANEALENWEWEEIDERIDPGDTTVFKSFLEGWDEEFVRESFADDDGNVRLSQAFSDIWDWLDEFAISSYRTWQADREYYK